jgi:hypothetical protein
LTAVLGSDSVKPLAAGAPVLTGRFGGGIGADLSKSLLLRSASSQPATPGAPALLGAFLGGRLAAVLSPYGLTCSIEGAPCVENVGYTTADARKIALNVILYAAVGGR